MVADTSGTLGSVHLILRIACTAESHTSLESKSVCAYYGCATLPVVKLLVAAHGTQQPCCR
jgi:hypothetical protein